MLNLLYLIYCKLLGVRLLEENNFYILFDGNFPDLSFLEFKYLIAGLDPNIEYKKELLINDVFLVKIKGQYLHTIKIFQQYTRMVSLTKEIGMAYFFVDYQQSDSFDEILFKLIETINIQYLDFKIDQNTTFKVEMIKRGILNNKLFSSENRQRILFSIADSLIGKFNLKADLKSENITITLILTPSKIFFGQRIFKTNRKLIMNRTPSNRSYFHSGSMNPILIRAMINLGLKFSYSPTKETSSGKSLLLDPFMGAGGILMEAGTMNYATVGIELGYWMTRGARMNLSDMIYSGYNSSFWSIIRSDSNNIPLKSNSIDIIVTDPPYGHSTILGGQKLEDLLANVLNECRRVLKRKSRMVISIPSTIDIKFDGFTILEKIYDRVHNSLTRIIYLLEKIEISD